MTPGLPPQNIHIAFEAGPYRMAMGLLAQDPDELVEIDEHYPAELAEKRHLFATNRDAVFATVPGSEAGSMETLRTLADLLPRRFPAWFQRDGERLHNRLTGETWTLSDPALHPLELAARLVQEDFCLIRPASDGPILIAAALCFPSRWVLADKIGRPLADVHATVPLYGERLAKPVDRFMAQLRPGKLVQRLNWSLLDDPALFQPVRKTAREQDASITPQTAGARVFLRSERQTLSLLPGSGAVLFGIRVHVYPLHRIAARPDMAARLAAAVRALPPEIVGYKRLAGFQDAMLAYLDARSAA